MKVSGIRGTPGLWMTLWFLPGLGGEVELDLQATCCQCSDYGCIERLLLSQDKPMEERCHTCLHMNCKLSAVSCEPSVHTMQLWTMCCELWVWNYHKLWTCQLSYPPTWPSKERHHRRDWQSLKGIKNMSFRGKRKEKWLKLMTFDW